MSRGDRSLFQFSATQKPYIVRLKGHQRPRTPFLSSLVSLRTDSQAPLTTLRELEDLYSFEAVAHNAPSSATLFKSHTLQCSLTAAHHLWASTRLEFWHRTHPMPGAPPLHSFLA